jgi:two-component system CheB/CheR fusion protein
VLATGKPVERDLRDVDGKAFFLRVLPYRARGVVDGVVLTMIDVSGLKAAEDALFHERHLLNSLLGTVPDAIYFKSADGRFIRANDAMAPRLGLAGPALAAGKTALDVPNREAALELHREDEATLKSGEAQHYRLERRARPDGGEGWDLATRLPLHAPDGRTVGVIVIIRDVTAQKTADERIQEAVRRRDEFLAMLSHELRNPLGAMVTGCALLRDGVGGRPDADWPLQVLERQSEQMARLLDDLLEASRVTQNKIELRKSVVDLRRVASEAAEAVRGRMQAHGLRLEVVLPEEPVWVDGDPARLQQIQANLLGNAAKYTPWGGRVRLSVGRESGEAVARVQDEGIGIAPGMLESVFDLFVQCSRSLDRSAGGLGVGLTLVRSLVAMHGGTVAAHSEGEGKGSEFVVRLPAAAAPAAAAPSEAVRPPLPPPPHAANVVVVEDNADSREMLCAILGRAGLECRSAASGPEALALVDQAPPDIVILDVGLPGLDGLEIARRIRADSRLAGVRLVALTGYGQAADRAASTAAGFDDHLVKPVHPQQILALLAGMRGDGSAGPQRALGPSTGRGEAAEEAGSAAT